MARRINGDNEDRATLVHPTRTLRTDDDDNLLYLKREEYVGENVDLAMH
jgi:hypothetical protein